MDKLVDDIVDCMAASGTSMSDIQRVQTEYRVKLARFWDIKNGSCLLEIGCGQGDTTAVLAHFVGETGLVHGVDVAPPTYGSPITLGNSAKVLVNSRIGKRIKMEFDIDILSPEIDFPRESFDTVVLSHCSWYLKSYEEFSALLRKLRKWGKTLVFAEWDSRITTIEQLPHLLAVLIQAEYECFKDDSTSNVRTLFTPDDVKRLLEDAGWSITKEATIRSPDLQDGHWEVNQTLADWQLELGRTRQMPSKLKSLIASQVNLLDGFVRNMDIRPLSTYAVVAQ